ncbi:MULTISPECIES: hypothetical protein [Paenibacillus]|uniref:Uncharacterized protein n=1 Tax=Paenibacillus vini TaxID=1476024 RepID=A0ABQ4MH41_9BACL|nr:MULTISPECIES: hypothetical protein [Paenibacillus]MBQ4898582.1 hypothetical protein [Paenibacillus sp. Marseille-P2973]MDN4069892.1 hypothetical protein [Paenibacillus vini]GIP55283.1 hypothetical protein J42TS3_43180 [Paenibacillus vini]
MPNRGRPLNKNRNKNRGNSSSNIISDEITSDDLAIIGAGLAVLGDLFAFLSLIKVQQEEKDAAAGKEK